MFTFTILTTDHAYVESIRTIRCYAFTTYPDKPPNRYLMYAGDCFFFSAIFSKVFRLEMINCELKFELKYDSTSSRWTSCAICEIFSATRCRERERELRAPYCKYTNAIKKYHCRSDSCAWSGFSFIKFSSCHWLSSVLLKYRLHSNWFVIILTTCYHIQAGKKNISNQRNQMNFQFQIDRNEYWFRMENEKKI